VTAVVLDGGLATRLEAMGLDLSGPMWSARLIAEAPQSIVDAHGDFIRAGADVVTTASYQTTDPSLVARSVALARDAVSRFDRPLWIAGSVGPYGAVLADGSEYRGNYGVSRRSSCWSPARGSRTRSSRPRSPRTTSSSRSA
jgi:homocysteine S-methyltransferase